MLSILGRFNVFGVTGVSACGVGNNGLSKNGKLGSCNDTLDILLDMFAITFDADVKGSRSPIFLALSAKAFLISGDIFIGLKILLSIEFTSTPDNLPTAVLKSLSPIFKTLAASISFLNSFLILNNDLFAFI